MREEVEEIKKEVSLVKEQSLAMEILNDYKKANKRLFIVILVILTMWFSTIAAFVYYINTIGYEETVSTIDIEDVDSVDNSHIKIGDDNWEK